MVTPGGQRAGGRVLARRYHLQRVLGRGAMGAVWEAEDTFLRRTVAVKEVVLPGSLSPEERAVSCERTLREARAIARLGHPNVVTLFDVLDEDARPWVVMELVPSRSLAEVIKEDGPLHPLRVATVGLAILGALEAAHAAGITHRDVKPGNILLGHDGRVKLTDFGIARAAGDDTITGTGLLVGSPSYIAPEIVKGLEAGAPADMWGLGATLYAAVEGRAPFSGGDAMETLSKVVQEPADAVRAGRAAGAGAGRDAGEGPGQAGPAGGRTAGAAGRAPRRRRDRVAGAVRPRAGRAFPTRRRCRRLRRRRRRRPDRGWPTCWSRCGGRAGPRRRSPAARPARAGRRAGRRRAGRGRLGAGGRADRQRRLGAPAAPVGGPAAPAAAQQRRSAGRQRRSAARQRPSVGRQRRSVAGSDRSAGRHRRPRGPASDGAGDRRAGGAGRWAGGGGRGRDGAAAGRLGRPPEPARIRRSRRPVGAAAATAPAAAKSVAGSTVGERAREVLADDADLVDPEVADPELVGMDAATRTDLGAPLEPLRDAGAAGREARPTGERRAGATSRRPRGHVTLPSRRLAGTARPQAPPRAPAYGSYGGGDDLRHPADRPAPVRRLRAGPRRSSRPARSARSRRPRRWTSGTSAPAATGASAASPPCSVVVVLVVAVLAGGFLLVRSLRGSSGDTTRRRHPERERVARPGDDPDRLHPLRGQRLHRRHPERLAAQGAARRRGRRPRARTRPGSSG